jgi:hypothetical protein
MNKLSTCYILFILLIPISRIIAQHKDCATALELCGHSPLYIVPAFGIGSTDAGVASTCIGQEFNSMWFKWTVMEDGIISFVLAPDSVWQDLDFIVYEPGDEYDCIGKIPIRCMAAGANSGQPPHTWVNCTGPTGLAPGNTDAEEPPGCPSGSNNFLAPIEALAGDQYIMLVNEFSQSGLGYLLTFTGTAKLSCITGTADPEWIKPRATYSVYPTVSTGTLFIRITGDKLSDNHLNVFNTHGQLVYSNEQLHGTDFELDLHHLPPGVYVAALRSSHSIQTQRFLITN